MLVPVRCFTCNKVIAPKFKEFKKLQKTNDNVSEIFKELEIKRYCCKRMLLTSVESFDELSQYTNSLPIKVTVSKDYTSDRIFSGDLRSSDFVSTQQKKIVLVNVKMEAAKSLKNGYNNCRFESYQRSFTI